MKMSQVTIYAIQALRLLDKHSPMSTDQIAQRLDISYSYAKKVARALLRAEVVKGRNGPQGGYALIVPLEKISVARLVDAAELLLPDRKGDTQAMIAIRRKVRSLLTQAMEEPVAKL